jgi:hypothetical protein
MQAQRIHALSPTTKRPCPYCCSCCDSMDRNVEVKMKLFLMCLLYVEEIFFTRQKARKDIQKPCLLDFYFFIENAIFLNPNLELKVILRAIFEINGTAE